MDVVRSSIRCFWAVYLWGYLSLTVTAQQLPIYLEDSHTGSFAFFAQTLDLDAKYTLILLDAHSDASGIPESDRIRNGLRHVVSENQRKERISQWRTSGVIQPFNWIEPLMPHPITKVIWIAGESLSREKLADLQREAGIHLDWQTQVAPRECGALKHRFQVTDWKTFRTMKIDGNVVVSIDLDYYAQKSVDENVWSHHWETFLKMPRLKALSFAVSRPWLTDDAQGYRLLERALSSALSVRNASVQFEPFLHDVVDRSELAKSLLRQGKKIPRLNLDNAPASLKDLLVRQSANLKVQHAHQQWQKLLDKWRADRSGWVLSLRHKQQGVDGIWRLPVHSLADIQVTGGDEQNAHRLVRWWVLKPSKFVYNLSPDFLASKAFADRVGSYVQNHKHLIKETDDLALAARTWREFLPLKGKAGILRIQAEIVGEHSSEWTPVMEIRVSNATGFRSGLSEQMGLPYVFGIGQLAIRGESGPETLIGNDCANFMVYAMRRAGRPIPWCNPKQLRKYLQQVGGTSKRYHLNDKVPLSQEMIERGTIVHLGSHVAAVWADRGELGVLDSHDLVIHHLSGPPEIITLKKLMKRKTFYELFVLPRHQPNVTIELGGDVNLAGAPFHSKIFSETLKKRLQNADFSLINLECALDAPSNKSNQPSHKRFQFIAKPKQLQSLTKAGIDAVSLANNHTMDAGEKGLLTLVTSLRQHGISHVGAGRNILEAMRPLTVSLGNQKQKITVAFVALNTIETEDTMASPHAAGVLSFPQHQKNIAEAIQKAHDRAQYVIVLPHWGKEYTRQLTRAQRSLAKWLIRHGADAVVGSHSHHIQPIQYYRGHPIVFSLGNLYFPNKGPKGFNQYHLLEMTIDQKRGIRCSFTPSIFK